MKLTKKWMAAAMLLAFAWACTDNLTPVPDPEKPDELELSFGYSSPVESERILQGFFSCYFSEGLGINYQDIDKM